MNDMQTPPVPQDPHIRFVSFLRRLPDGSTKHAPVDFLAEEMVTWDQVVNLWGGGEYQAIAKNQKHQVLGHYPPGGKWMTFAGEPKPMVRPPCPPRSLPVDDPRAPILPPAVLSQPPVRGPIATTALAASGPVSVEAQGVWIREVELGELVGLPNPFDIRPRIGRLIREGVLSGLGLTRTADGGYLLSREAAVLITIRLKLKLSVRLDAVGVLLAGAQGSHPAPLALAPDMPPAQAAPPIVMNGEGATATFEGHTIPVYILHGRPVVVAADLGRALGYADKGLVKSIAEWTEFCAGRDFDVIEGADLRQFKAQMRLVPGSGTSRAANLTILYETGMDLACQKAQTEAGARLRRYLADHVLPRLRRGEPVGTGGAGGTQVPLVSTMAPHPSGPATPSPADTLKFHPVLVDRLDETSRRLGAVEERGRQIEARLALLESRPPWLA